MKASIFAVCFFFSTFAFAQNVAFSCDGSDFHAEGIIQEDAHGYLFAVDKFSFLVKGELPMSLRASSTSSLAGRRISFTLPDGRPAEISIRDNGDTDYSSAAAELVATGFEGKSLYLTCSAASMN